MCSLVGLGLGLLLDVTSPHRQASYVPVKTFLGLPCQTPERARLDIIPIRCDYWSELEGIGDMLSKSELVWLHAFQGTMALKRDWIAVGHLQGLIDHLAGEHGVCDDAQPMINVDLATH